MEYRQAPEVEAIAKELIEEHHEVLRQRGPIIDYVMMKAKNGTRMFKLGKVTGINAFLAAGRARPTNFYTEPQAPDRVAVAVGHIYWAAMTDKQRRGLVDHILSHLKYDFDRENWTIEPPEYGEFPEVLERHGFWRPGDGFKRFAAKMSEQLSLLPPEEMPSDEDDQMQLGEDDLDVSITFGDRTVNTSTATMRKVADGLNSGRLTVKTPGGDQVDAETGEFVEEHETEGARA